MNPMSGKPDQTTVFSFPVASPGRCVNRNDMTAIEQLDTWLVYAKEWCEHHLSRSQYAKKSGWMWVHGSGRTLITAPALASCRIPITPTSKLRIRTAHAKYEELRLRCRPGLTGQDLANYESEDNTTGTQELSCTAGVYEVVDIAKLTMELGMEAKKSGGGFCRHRR